MRSRHGQFTVEVGISLVLLMATSGSLAMLVKSLASGREANARLVSERLLIESTAERLLAVRYESIDESLITLAAETSLQLTAEPIVVDDITGTRIHLQSNRFRRVSLSVWRFPAPSPRVSDEVPLEP